MNISTDKITINLPISCINQRRFRFLFHEYNKKNRKRVRKILNPTNIAIRRNKLRWKIARVFDKICGAKHEAEENYYNLGSWQDIDDDNEHNQSKNTLKTTDTTAAKVKGKTRSKRTTKTTGKTADKTTAETTNNTSIKTTGKGDSKPMSKVTGKANGKMIQKTIDSYMVKITRKTSGNTAAAEAPQTADESISYCSNRTSSSLLKEERHAADNENSLNNSDLEVITITSDDDEEESNEALRNKDSDEIQNNARKASPNSDSTEKTVGKRANNEHSHDSTAEETTLNTAKMFVSPFGNNNKTRKSQDNNDQEDNNDDYIPNQLQIYRKTTDINNSCSSSNKTVAQHSENKASCSNNNDTNKSRSYKGVKNPCRISGKKVYYDDIVGRLSQPTIDGFAFANRSSVFSCKFAEEPETQYKMDISEACKFGFEEPIRFMKQWRTKRQRTSRNDEWVKRNGKPGLALLKYRNLAETNPVELMKIIIKYEKEDAEERKNMSAKRYRQRRALKTPNKSNSSNINNNGDTLSSGMDSD